jgi:hypothetical protein
MTIQPLSRGSFSFCLAVESDAADGDAHITAAVHLKNTKLFNIAAGLTAARSFDKILTS